MIESLRETWNMPMTFGRVLVFVLFMMIGSDIVGILFKQWGWFLK